MDTITLSTVKILDVKPILTDKQLEKKEGKFINEKHYNKIITSNYDVYGILEDGTRQLLLKFRKNVIPIDICNTAFNALEKHAQHKNYNRGAASGSLDIKKLPSYVGKITKKDKFRIYYNTKRGNKTNDNVGNMAMSNIAGYYDKPDRNEYVKLKTNTKTKTIKKISKKIRKNISKHSIANGKDRFGIPLCRTTQFTKNEVEKWNNTLPLIHHINKQFKLLVPDRYKIQLERAQLTPAYQIAKTAYSTLTINYDWRTACHKDKGDYEEGFGNLIVLEKQNPHNTGIKPFTGGYIGFPKWGICVDVCQGDFLAMDVHEWHCNTLIKGSGRLSIVCYLRKNMINCRNHE